MRLLPVEVVAPAHDETWNPCNLPHRMLMTFLIVTEVAAVVDSVD